MKSILLDINGKKLKDINLPKCFSQKIRGDIVSKVLEVDKNRQPYSPSPVAGKQHSASGTLIHRRKVWKSQYGRGMSRIPRKSLSRRGTQFNWVGAEIPGTRGGRRAHPPKILAMINTKRINKKELKIALMSAISATADEKQITKRYEKLNGKKLSNIPIIVESKIISLKTKDLVNSLKKILEENLFDLALQKKTVRSGKGKKRGRKYKKNAGGLFVIGNKENIKINNLDIRRVNNVSVTDLAKGGLGRITIYTEQAIKELEDKFKEK